METSDVFAAVKTRFLAQWALTAYAAAPVYWPNEPDDVPAAPFVRVEIQFGAARTAAYGAPPGSNLYRQSGEVLISCYAASVDAANGDSQARLMAEAAAKIFRSYKTGGSLRFYHAAPQASGVQDGSYYAVTAICAFDFDTVG